jgi:hypothetical protein
VFPDGSIHPLEIISMILAESSSVGMVYINSTTVTGKDGRLPHFNSRAHVFYLTGTHDHAIFIAVGHMLYPQ